MKKSWRFWVYCGLFGLLSVGIVKVSGGSKLFAFSHSLDVHANEMAFQNEAKKIMRREAEERKRLAEEKERKEKEENEKEEKEAREKKKEENDRIRREEELKSFKEWQQAETRRVEDQMRREST